MRRAKFALGLLLVFVTFFSSRSEAGERAKVLKRKGNKAIIVLPRSHTLRSGDIFYYSRDSMSLGTDNGRRDHFISGDFAWRSSSVTLDRSNVPEDEVSVSSFEFTGRLGWNTGKTEYGPLIDLDIQDEDGSTTSSLGVGGFYEFNFKDPNTPGRQWVPAAGAALKVLLIELNTQSGQGFGFEGYVGGKYFLFDDDLAFRGFFSLGQQRTSLGSGSSLVSLDVKVTVGLANYF